MYCAENIKWLKYLLYMALTGSFILLLILTNLKQTTYYREQNAVKKAITSPKPPGSRSLLSLEETSARAVDCSTSSCVVSCSGDMTSLNKFLDSVAGVCASIKLKISNGIFSNDQLEKNWLKGKFNLSSISITGGSLTSIQSGAFDQSTVASMTELTLSEVQLDNLTQDTFVGLKAIDKFTFVNQIESFYAVGFLKPMVTTLNVLTMKHVTSRATDPEPWLRGGSYPNLLKIVFDGSNFGGYIEAKTFSPLKELCIVSLAKCQITYIADGAFDYMMSSHMVVYINLQHNQLKRLAGNYLSRLNSLRRIDIQYNLWDCTCELEDLVREFKRYPDGFGVDTVVKCSSPLELEGEYLGDVNVENCEETSTITTASSSSSSSSTAISSSTIDPETPTPSSTDSETTSTLSSSTTDVTPPSTESTSTSTPSPSTDPVTPSSSSTSTTPSLPTPQGPKTTPSPTSPETENQDDETTPIDNEITNPSPTSPSPQNTTTAVSAVTTTITCQQDSATSSVELSQPNTHFSISRRGEKSAKLILEDPLDGLAIIWFSDQPNISETGDNVQRNENSSVGYADELENSLVINGLATNQAYTFCLIKKDESLVSPFDCRSYYTGQNEDGAIDADEVWLKREDIALTTGLLIFGIIVSLCGGVIGMFVVLRMKPTLLRGSKRVIVVNRSSADVLIMPKSEEKKSSLMDSSNRSSSDTNTTIPQRRFSETSILSGRSYMMANYYEDIEERWKMHAANDLMYANRVPTSLPPPLPKRVSQNDPKETQRENDYGYIS